MNLEERKSLLYRIIQGKIIYKNYIIYTPTLDILVDSQYFYNSILDENKYEEWISHEDCIKWLIYNGIYKKSDDDLIKTYIKEIEKTKIQIYKSFFNFQRRQELKKEVKELTEKINDLEQIKCSLDCFTLDGFANILKQQYILARTVHNLDNTLLFDNYKTANFSLLHDLYYIIAENTISHIDFRELARSEPWTTIWKVEKNSIFNLSGVNLSNDQKYLLLYSKMYDGVYDSTDEPHEDIINDDDALDGWFLIQKQNRDKEKKDKTANDVLNIRPDAQEVFIPANSFQEIKQIESFNDLQGQMVKTQRNEVIKKLGEVSESQLPDQQMVIRQKILEQQGIKHG